MSIRYINPDETWQQYGLIQRQIEHNGKPTKYNTIERYDKIVTMATKRYALLPNEEALRIVNIATEKIGLKPFNTTNGAQKLEYCQGYQHAVIDKGTRLNAFYYFRDEHIQNEKVYFGLHIYNSIDRSTAFGAGAYTFRVSCSNQVIARLKHARSTISQGETLAYIYERHSGAKFEQQYFDRIIQKLQAVCAKTQDVINAYKTMAVTNVNKDLMEKLVQSQIPVKVRPDYFPKEKDQTVLEVPKITQWELYNDFTANIWHNEKTNLQAKETQFNLLHKLMPIQV